MMRKPGLFLHAYFTIQSDGNAYRQPAWTRTMRILPASTRVIKCVTSILAPQCPDAWRSTTTTIIIIVAVVVTIDNGSPTPSRKSYKHTSKRSLLFHPDFNLRSSFRERTNIHFYTIIIIIATCCVLNSGTSATGRGPVRSPLSRP